MAIISTSPATPDEEISFTIREKKISHLTFVGIRNNKIKNKIRMKNYDW